MILQYLNSEYINLMYFPRKCKFLSRVFHNESRFIPFSTSKEITTVYYIRRCTRLLKMYF